MLGYDGLGLQQRGPGRRQLGSTAAVVTFRGRPVEELLTQQRSGQICSRMGIGSSTIPILSSLDEDQRCENRCHHAINDFSNPKLVYSLEALGILKTFTTQESRDSNLA